MIYSVKTSYKPGRFRAEAYKHWYSFFPVAYGYGSTPEQAIEDVKQAWERKQKDKEMLKAYYKKEDNS